MSQAIIAILERIEALLGGGGATSPNKVEDTPAASGDSGLAIMAIQVTNPSDLAGDGDYAFAQMKNGRLFGSSNIDSTGGVTLPLDDAAAGAEVPIPVGGKYNSTSPAYTNGDRVQAQFGARGYLKIEQMVPGGTQSYTPWNSPADGTTNSVTIPLTGAYQAIYNGTTWDRVTSPNAASRIASSAASTNATSAKASAGRVHRITYNNASGAVRYLKFYNKASAPTVGTDTPVLAFSLPPGADNFDVGGHYFSTGIAYGLTTGAADADTGALSSGDILGLNIQYS